MPKNQKPNCAFDEKDPYAWIRRKVSTMNDEEKYEFMMGQLDDFLDSFEMSTSAAVDSLAHRAGYAAAWAPSEVQGHAISAALQALSDGFFDGVGARANAGIDAMLASATTQGNA